MFNDKTLKNRREPTRSKSKLHWRILAYQEAVKDFCLSPRQSRIAWDDRRSEIKPHGFRSKLLKYRISIWSPYLKRKIKGYK